MFPERHPSIVSHILPLSGFDRIPLIRYTEVKLPSDAHLNPGYFAYFDYPGIKRYPGHFRLSDFQYREFYR